MTTTETQRSPGLQAALDAKRESDEQLRSHVMQCFPCSDRLYEQGLLCPGGERLNDACDAALDALKAEIGR